MTKDINIGASRPKLFKVAALYKFVALPDYETLQKPLLYFCKTHNVRGTILLAEEGINGTVAGSETDIDKLIVYLTGPELFHERLSDLDVKYSYASGQPFLRMKVRLKSEIVTLRAEEADPTVQVGTYVAPEDWNELISDPDIIVIDTRNDYEVAIGTFPGAIDPKTENFTQFKEFVAENLSPKHHKKVAMFCTGGIRCEKASSYMLAQGFNEVYHLKGGILKYLETVPERTSLWQGDCFVFDDRVAVSHSLKESPHRLCHACRWPLSENDLTHEDYVEGIQCPRCKDRKSEEERARAISRQRQMELAKARGIAHLGDDAAAAAEILREEKRAIKNKVREKTAQKSA